MRILQMPARAVTAEAPEAVVLPTVWATEGSLAVEAAAAPARRADVLEPGTAFYRSYTEAMLRRYGVLRMESGRVPSMLGREMFRGRVTSYRVHAFDDVVIFVHDVERCLAELSPRQQRLIHRIGVQEYTFAEAARMLEMGVRTAQRHYYAAVDELTSVFLRKRLLERIASDPCQEGERSAAMVSRLSSVRCR